MSDFGELRFPRICEDSRENTLPWTEITRIKYRRDGLRYASDLTDAEWALIARQMPPRQRLGRPREVDLREVVQAIFYILSTGCQWRALPGEFPPYSTVQGYFFAWRDTGRWHQIVRILVRRARKKLVLKPRPTAGHHRQPDCFDNAGRWTARLRSWQAPPWAQAAHRHRYQWSFSSGPCPPCERSGCSWRCSLAGALARLLPKAPECFCRSGLSRQTAY